MFVAKIQISCSNFVGVLRVRLRLMCGSWATKVQLLKYLVLPFIPYQKLNLQNTISSYAAAMVLLYNGCNLKVTAPHDEIHLYINNRPGN